MKNQLLLDNGICKWYLHDEINKYINSCQEENLPILNNLICCNVVGVELDDLVLIDGKQNIIHCQYNTFDGMEQNETRRLYESKRKEAV